LGNAAFQPTHLSLTKEMLAARFRSPGYVGRFSNIATLRASCHSSTACPVFRAAFGFLVVMADDSDVVLYTAIVAYDVG
jgi:hypothetical protein